jgi:hypothetical protein
MPDELTFDEREFDDPYDYVDPEYDAACSAVESAWAQQTGESPPSSLSHDAVQSAAEVLVEGWDVVGDEDGGPELIWKIEPLEALARVRPRIAASIRPSAIVAARTCLPRTKARTSRSRRSRRRVRTARTSRGSPDDDEPGEPGH